jgi:hypothetical protein
MFEYKLGTILLLLEAAAYLALAGWCLTRRREGTWAIGVAVGGLLVGVILGLAAAASFEQVFLDSTHIYEEIFFHEHVGTVFTVARLLGVLLLAAGVVASRRTPPVSPSDSIYGA